MIDPSVWTHERFMTLSMNARLLFFGLISQADDEGRGRAHPLSLKAALFPGDPMDGAEVVALLSEVTRAGFARVYGEGRYYHLPGWKDHQTVNRPSPSKLPEPPPAGEEEEPDSVRAHGGFSEDSVRTHLEGKGSKGKGIKGTHGALSEGSVRAKRFKPPEKPEVEAYILEKGLSFSADAFMDHYEANGWKRGKTPIVDWKAACRTWEHRRRGETQGGPQPAASPVRILP
jgi:hypothetical protein